ncbi:TIGR04211 family SH3 domain-containing protein [Permianibacter sp. IMCC34836]|uniref:TIGR04211 family SH3 domain-containing protein n=1 Tax=Permianibacter fluminis TaxID=2738515 RepID=UPI00155454A1|nr:TIGR04211 family SH3 domain-containing protein [Permianibacter fluminis]NQD35428.1 TIGR04211 family SH3 domain-containing protein [Permianibacter fluminis]
MAVIQQGLGLLMALSVASAVLAAEPAPTPTPSHYITDQLTASLRAGAAKEQKAINQIRAGEPVQIMEKAPGTGFVRVRAASGPEGWIEAERVVTTPPAVARFAELETRFNAAVSELEGMKASLPEREVLQRQSHELQVRVVELENQLETLTEQNAVLERRFQSEVMYAGALIVLVGLVLGWGVSAMRGRRRDGWH